MQTTEMYIQHNVLVYRGKLIDAYVCVLITYCHVSFPYRLGQACSHIAALLFFIEHHAHDDGLPVKKSKTSLPMKWNQPSKKAVAPACANEMMFVKPSYGDVPRAHSAQAHRNTFEPCHSEHCTLHKESLDRLLVRIEKSVPTTGLQQFWLTKAPGDEVPQILWNYVIFSHKHFSTVMRDKFFTPTIAQCYDYLHGMILDHDEVARIETATKDQSECELWFALCNSRLTSSRFGKILN